MRLSITAKLFVAMAAVSVMAIVATALSARLSFDHDFIGYLGEQEQIRLEAGVPPLAAAYKAHGSWAFLREDPSIWGQLMRSTVPIAPGSMARLPTLPVSDLIGAKPRFTLLDTQDQYVFGNPQFVRDTRALSRPILVDGRLVGRLVMLPFKRVSEVGDLRFQHGQARATWTITLIAILLVALLTWWMARALSAPLRRLAAATHRLAAHDYAERVPLVSGGEIGQLERDFNSLAQTLEKHEKQRREMVADVSHELRTPIAVMRGELEALQEGIRPLDGAAITSLATEAERLGALVNDLYDLSLVDVGAMRFHPVEFDLADLVGNVVRGMGKRVAASGVALRTSDDDAPVYITGDTMRLRQVLVNLLENAFRYVPGGGQVRVDLSQAMGRAVIDVIDNGPGVPDDALTQLFNRFYRVDASRSRQTGGAGLGLAICQGIVSAHHGQIEARRAPGGGLWIRISLPSTGGPA